MLDEKHNVCYVEWGSHFNVRNLQITILNWNHTLANTRSKPFASGESRASKADFINFAAAWDRLPIPAIILDITNHRSRF